MQSSETESPHGPKILFSREFILAVLAAFFSAAAIHSLTPTLPIYLERSGSSEKEIGILVGIFAVATLISRFFMGTALAKYREKTVMIFGASVCVITSLASVVFRPFWPFLVIRCLQGTTLACMDTAILVFVLSIVPLGIGPVAMGMIVPLTGYPVMFRWLALISLINFCYFQFYVRRRRKGCSAYQSE